MTVCVCYSLVKDNTKLKELCTVMGVSPFKDPDIKFLGEFVQCMQPIVDIVLTDCRATNSATWLM